MSATAKLGAFMLLALIILGVFIVKIEDLPLGGRGSRTSVKALFPSVAGLDAKSPVRIAGVRVGIVDTIELSDSKALVTLALEPGVELRVGATAEVTSLGMLGDKYIELNPGPPDNPPLPPDAILPGTSPVGFDQVLRSASNIGSDLEAITGSLRGQMAGPDGEQRIDEILENIRQLTAEVRAMVAANRSDVDATIDNFRQFSATLAAELPRLADKLNSLADRVDSLVADNRSDIDDSIANIKDLTGRLRVTADNLNTITGKIAAGEGTIGKLVNDEETVDNLNSTLKAVEGGVASLKNTIGRAERYRLNMNLRAEALPGVDDSRTAFGADLYTTDKRFYRLELVDSPLGKVKTTTETITRILPDGTRETIIEEREKRTDENTINAQVGYELPRGLTVRAGLFESTGGVAVDQRLFQQRLKLSLEAYDFGRDEDAPHFRLEGRYFLNRNLFTYAGWDDPTLSDRSSVLFGAGITWLDEDLKYLLGTAAAFGN